MLQEDFADQVDGRITYILQGTCIIDGEKLIWDKLKQPQASTSELLKSELMKEYSHNSKNGIFLMATTAQKKTDEISKKAGLFSGLTGWECKRKIIIILVQSEYNFSFFINVKFKESQTWE